MNVDMDNNTYFVVFYSYNHTTFFLNKFAGMGINVVLISTPCTITQGCSQSLKFKGESLNAIMEEIKKNNVNVRGIYKIVRNGTRSYYENVPL